jgi:hypothetical protein
MFREQGAEENMLLEKELSESGWRKLHEELCNLYFSQNIIKRSIQMRIQWLEHVACTR